MRPLNTTFFNKSLGLALAIMLVVLAACGSESESPSGTEQSYTFGILNTFVPEQNPIMPEVKRALADRGFIEGENVTILEPDVEDTDEARQQAAQELVDTGVDVILLGGPSDVAAARAVTTTVPLVMTWALDPVGQGLIESLRQPGGNITGVFVPVAADRRLKWLVDAIPGLETVFMPYFSNVAESVTIAEAALAVAPDLGIDLVAYAMTDVSDLSGLWDAMPDTTRAVFLGSDPRVNLFYLARGADLIDRKIAITVPVGVLVFPSIFLGYGINPGPSADKVARLVEQVLGGTPPGDLPVESADFSLVISLVAAEALDIEVPDTVLRQADFIVRADEE